MNTVRAKIQALHHNADDRRAANQKPFTVEHRRRKCSRRELAGSEAASAKFEPPWATESRGLVAPSPIFLATSERAEPALLAASDTDDATEQELPEFPCIHIQL